MAILVLVARAIFIMDAPVGMIVIAVVVAAVLRPKPAITIVASGVQIVLALVA